MSQSRVKPDSNLTVNFYPDRTPGMTTDNGVLGREAGEQLLWNPVLLPWDWVQGGLSSVQTSPLSVMLIMALV